MSNLFWVGSRESDIDNTNLIFEGSITIFGSNTNGNIAYCKNNKRINHNIDHYLCEQFIKQKLIEIIKQNPKAKFVFYDQKHAYSYGNEILKHSIGINDEHLLESLSDKSRNRFVFSNFIKVIPFVTLKGEECVYERLCNYFDGDEYIIQKTFSCGGDGTYHITKDNLSALEVMKNEKNSNFILSPYLKNGIPLNIHVIISDTNIMLFPASIQIVYERNAKILYSGADFICFQQLPENIKAKVNSYTYKISSFLKDKGYIGILGIDFMLHNDELFFMELNPRFQASSDLINRGIKKSLQELHLMAFRKEKIQLKSNYQINYSNYVYTTHNISVVRLERVLSSSEIKKIQLDGFNPSEIRYDEEDVYLCRCVFERNICSLSNKKLILHPNIFVENIKPYILGRNKYFRECIKFSLLNHGVSLSKDAILYATQIGIIKNAVFDAIDMTIFNSVRVNVPYSCKFTSISPFVIDVKENTFILLFDNYEVTTIKIDFVPECLIDKKTSTGIPFDAIINLSTDRIRINPAPVCVYKENGLSCQFCNLQKQNYKYGLDDIKETIDYCLEYVTFRHFLIGGGTYSLDGGWSIILEIAEYIRSKSSKDIYLMAIPPKEKTILNALKNAGITEVAFNLEIFDRELAMQVMPGKGKLPLSQYLETFNHSVSLWGNTGKVRTLLIYGFDTEKNFINGIEQLCAIGVEPIISIFRPLSNTVLENLNPPPTLDIFSVYEKCKNIVEHYSLCLGPDCPDCQNNTLSFSIK